MKLTKDQKENVLLSILLELKRVSAKTTKDAEIIIMEMMNEEFDEIYHLIEETWKNPTKALIRAINKIKIVPLIQSDEFTMIE